jgi:hypothetical protein
MNGTCPHFKNLVIQLIGPSVEITVGNDTYKGATFMCPFCNLILRAGADPVSMAEHTEALLMAELAKIRSLVRRV